MSETTSLVYNPDASGSMASRFGERAKLWNKHVRSFPKRAAQELIRFGGLYLALRLEQVATRYGIPHEVLQRILPELFTETYEPHDKSAPAEMVVVLDGDTARR